jgi:two-component system response regulator QseB
MRILVVEDDERISALLSGALAAAGFVVEVEHDGGVAWYRGDTESFDAVVLDLGLPRLDGLTLLRRWRGEGRTVPVLILTARAQWEERVEGIEAGADDYVVKPFDLDELAARIRALGRRGGGRAAPRLVHGTLTLDPASREVTQGGEPVALSPREFALLAALMARPGAVLSRAQLEEKLYGWDEPVESNAVEVHLHSLRKKIGAGAIRNVRGVGWTLAAA